MCLIFWDALAYAGANTNHAQHEAQQADSRQHAAADPTSGVTEIVKVHDPSLFNLPTLMSKNCNTLEYMWSRPIEAYML